jgi:hypothetical protein
MRKSRKILLIVVAAVILLSASTAFAAQYSGSFWTGYTTGADVYIGTNGYIHLNDNTRADYNSGGTWYSGSYFTTTALHDGSPYESTSTTVDTDYYFWWTGDRGRGRLRFANDISPWTNYQLRNEGEFF